MHGVLTWAGGVTRWCLRAGTRIVSHLGALSNVDVLSTSYVEHTRGNADWEQAAYPTRRLVSGALVLIFFFISADG